MIESPLIEELQAWTMHKAILRTSADRFGPVPVAVEQTLRTIQDEDRLYLLFRWSVECPDLNAFAARLAGGP